VITLHQFQQQAVAEGLDRALACLEAWGLLRGRAS